MPTRDVSAAYASATLAARVQLGSINVATSEDETTTALVFESDASFSLVIGRKRL